MSMGFVPQCEYDIFISYSHVDGRPWVERFAADLQSELVRRTPGRVKPRIYLDEHHLRTGDRLDDRIRLALQSSATFLALVTPNYLASRYCITQELAAFQKMHGRHTERLYQIVRTPLNGANPPVPQLKYQHFCDDVQEFMASEGRYVTAMQHVAMSLIGRLLQLRKQSTQLYIAWPSEPMHSDREWIAEEFRQQGFTVLPDQVFSEFSETDSIRRELGCADLSIHLFGEQWDTLAERQFQLACERGHPTIIATRNRAEQRRDPISQSAAVFLGDPNAIRHISAQIQHKLSASLPSHSLGTAPTIVLFYKPDIDMKCAWNLSEMIRERGQGRIHIVQPALGDSNFDLRLDDYIDVLGTARGVIVCWNAAPREWFDKIDDKLVFLMLSHSRLSRLVKGKYLVEPPPKSDEQLRNEFIIRREDDLDAYLAAVVGLPA